MCLTPSVVYLAKIFPEENPNDEKFYIGSTKLTFKGRYYGHKRSMNNLTYEKDTSLSIHYWKLIRENKTPRIHWKIIKKAKACYSLQSPCFLCLHEKMEITNFKDRDKLLNIKQESAISCKHFQIHTLKKL